MTPKQKLIDDVNSNTNARNRQREIVVETRNNMNFSCISGSVVDFGRMLVIVELRMIANWL